MKPWQIDKRVNRLSSQLATCPQTSTTIDWNCLSQPERELLGRIVEIIDEYAPAKPPQDVIEKNADLWYKGLEVFGRRVTELFVEILPETFCCDELEAWYFKVYFYNFMHDWLDRSTNCVKCQRSSTMRFFVNERRWVCLMLFSAFPKKNLKRAKKLQRRNPVESRSVNKKNRRIKEKIKPPPPSEGIRIDFNSFTEPEQLVLLKNFELEEKYRGRWTREVILENKDIILKANHIILSRVIELFTFVMPRAMMLDELDQWFFKFNFNAFWGRWFECQKNLQKWSKKDREAFLRDVKLKSKKAKNRKSEVELDGEDNNN